MTVCVCVCMCKLAGHGIVCLLPEIHRIRTRCLRDRSGCSSLSVSSDCRKKSARETKERTEPECSVRFDCCTSSISVTNASYFTVVGACFSVLLNSADVLSVS